MAKKEKLMVIPLGGLGEIGKNMTVIQYGNDIIVIDAGLAFPDDDMFGIDLVIPDMSYLIENRDKVRAVVITHGHEDHIGGLSYLLNEVNVPVYATKLVCGLIEGKLKENHITNYTLNEVHHGDEVQIGCMKVGFIHTNHSIPDASALYFRTPVGTIVHTGDFKMDLTPVDGLQMDIHKFAELGRRGVLLLMSDSTNAERAGYTESETTVGHAFRKAFRAAKGRIILATFASNISRIQQAINTAVQFKRKVTVLGRSMVNNVQIAIELGYLDVPEGVLIEPDELNRYPDDQILILTTGSQGEPMAGLSRMASNNHRSVSIMPGDTVIISATPIPGNETGVGRTIDNLMRLGANVIAGRDKKIHVSGHASQEELKLMLELIKPKYFIPVHGEYRMLVKHAELGKFMGVPAKNVVIGENGKVIEISKKSIKLNGTVQSGAVMVDGMGVGDVGSVVMRDRHRLAEDGMVVIVVTMSSWDNAMLAEPEILTRGFVYVKEAESMIEELKRVTKETVMTCEENGVNDWASIKSRIKSNVSSYLYKTTKRSPMILPLISEV